MSSWLFPTTADVGIRTFSHSSSYRRGHYWNSEYQISGHSTLHNSLPRGTELGQYPQGDIERGLVRWLRRGSLQGLWRSMTIRHQYQYPKSM